MASGLLLTADMDRPVEQFNCVHCGWKWTSEESASKTCVCCGKDALSSKQKKSVKKTPYPDDMRLFGEFHCSTCKRSWKSANSWVKKTQQCQGCQTNVLPHILRPLKRGFGPRDNNKPHPQHLCQKCQELGFYCREKGTEYPSWVYEDDENTYYTKYDDDEEVDALAGALANSRLD